jgi:hypothetical protein
MVSALCARSKNRTKLKTKEERSERRVRAITCSTWFFLGMVFVFQDVVSLYSSVVERQSCKLKVLGSIPSGGFLPSFSYVCLHVIGSHRMSSVHGSGVFVCGGFERGLLLAMTFFENLIPPPTSQSSIFVYNSKPSQLTVLGLAYLRAIVRTCNRDV